MEAYIYSLEISLVLLADLEVESKRYDDSKQSVTKVKIKMKKEGIKNEKVDWRRSITAQGKNNANDYFEKIWPKYGKFYSDKYKWSTENKLNE